MDAGGGVHKLEAILGSKTVLAHTLNAVQGSGLPMHVVQPSAHLLTMGDSIAQAVFDCPSDAGWLFLPADLPLIQASTIRQVADALMALGPGRFAVRPRFGEQLGHPVGFAASKRSDLLNCKGKSGAVSVFIESNAIKIEILDDGCVNDIDTPLDLQRLSDRLHGLSR